MINLIFNARVLGVNSFGSIAEALLIHGLIPHLLIGITGS
jgi:hypothetical protein